MEADRVVVELIAKVDQFDGRMKQSATSFGASMGQIEAAATKGEAAVKRAYAGVGQAQKMLGSQINDIGHLLESSRSPFTVISKQAPLSARAMGFVTAGATALGGIAGGFLVTSVLAGASALADLILKSQGAQQAIDDLVESLKEDAEKTDRTRAAKQAFALTLEGVTQAIRDDEEALKALNDANETAARKTLEHTALRKLQLQQIRDETQALIDNARAHLERQRALLTGVSSPQAKDFAAQGLPDAQKRLDALEAKLGKVDTAIGRAEKNFQEAVSRRVVELASGTAVEKIRLKYDKLVEATRARLVAEKATSAEIYKQTSALRDQQRVEEEKARKRKTSNPDQQAGRQITEADARRIVASIGGTVTSGFRTAAHNKDVGGQVNSYHLKGQAIDIAKTAGLTLGKIVKAFEDQGVRLIEKLDEGDHFHIAFGKRGASGPSQETLAKRALAAAEAEMRREQAFQNEKAELEGGVIDARQALMASAEEITKLELQAIEVARLKYNDNLASLVKQRKLLPAEAAELQKTNDARAGLRAELVKRREDERKFRIQEAAAQQQLQFQVGQQDVEAELLRSREGLATTAKERHELERQLIDLQFQEERLQLQAIVAGAERLRIETERIATLRALSDEEKAALKRAQDESALAQQRLDSQPERRQNAQTGNDRANASPLQDYLGQIPDTADEINAAFESIVAGGLTTFTDALTDAIVNFRSLGDVGRQVLASITAQLVRMAIQQVIMATVGKAISTASTAATGAQMAAIAAAAGPAAALVSLATSGANAIPAQAAIASTAALAAAIGASGFAGAAGFRSGGYTGDGPLGAVAGPVHRREFVFDAPAVQRIGVSNLEAMRRGVTPSNARAASPGSAGGLSSDVLPALRNIVTEAIQAMPDVIVQPTFDPVRALEAALNSNRGRRVMAEFMGDNRGAMNGALSQ